MRRAPGVPARLEGSQRGEAVMSALAARKWEPADSPGKRGTLPKPPAFDRRSSGLLLHVTSLPGRHGSGDLGREAHRFVDFCAEAGQTWWQMLPVGPPGPHPGNSPYSSYSSLAGSPYLVALDALGEDGLLRPAELRPVAGLGDRAVNFEAVRQYRDQRLRVAHQRFTEHRRRSYRNLRGEYERFCREQASWVDDFALYCAIKDESAGAPWSRWDPPLRSRLPAALDEARLALAQQVDFHRFVQFMFDRQWQVLHEHARRRGVGLIGDVPIFVAHDSVDVWCNPGLFLLDKNGEPTSVSGFPPDVFSKDGQRWGHPLYNWESHLEDGFRWWVERFRGTFRLFDALRIDHFLGFSEYWSIPAGSPTAHKGKWVKAPGHELFTALREALGERPIIAEDLGRATPEALALRDELGFPGMRILHQAFGTGGSDYNRPHSYVRRCVAYTGTHDNDTTVGWFKQLRPGNRTTVLDYVGGKPATIHLELIRAVMASVADTAIFPVQDLLGLDSRARMNTPGTAEGNWVWRVAPGALTPPLAKQLRYLTELTRRLPAT
jgi:4-alpha-glucanotransferase